MKYRRELTLDTEKQYWYVDMGPKPGMPDWHVLSDPSRYPFPTERAAVRFSRNHKQIDPTRRVRVLFPDGYILDFEQGDLDVL